MRLRWGNRAMRLSIVATALVVLGLLGASALAAAPPSPNIPCQMPGSDTATFLSVDELPIPIKQELAQYLGDSTGSKLNLAARDADFRETDFTVPTDTKLPPERFVQAGHAGTRWYVWIEWRGLGKGFQSLIFDLPKSRPDATFVAIQSVWPSEQLCPETQRHISDSDVTLGYQATVELSPGVPCTLPGNDNQTFLRVGDMALPVRQALARKFGDSTGFRIDMAARDTAFQETDSIDSSGPLLSFQRFIQGGHTGTFWYVWYEQGGMAYSYNIAYLELPTGTNGVVAKLQYTYALTVSDLCPLTIQLLAAQGR